MSERITISVTLPDRVTKWELEAWSTSSPYFAVHEAIMGDASLYGDLVDSWTVTHIPTGAYMLGPLPSRRLAEVIAAGIAKAPAQWELSDSAALHNSMPLALKQVLGRMQGESDRYHVAIYNLALLAGHEPIIAAALAEQTKNATKH